MLTVRTSLSLLNSTTSLPLLIAQVAQITLTFGQVLTTFTLASIVVAPLYAQMVKDAVERQSRPQTIKPRPRHKRLRQTIEGYVNHSLLPFFQPVCDVRLNGNLYLSKY